jgi:hypothetical protein
VNVVSLFLLARDRHDLALGWPTRQVFVAALDGSDQVGLGDDIVAVKDASRFVAAERHRDALRNAAADHIADAGPTQIVDEQLAKPCLRARGPIGFATAIEARNIANQAKASLKPSPAGCSPPACENPESAAVNSSVKPRSGCASRTSRRCCAPTTPPRNAVQRDG